MARSKLVSRGLLALCVFAIVQFVASTIYAHVIDGWIGYDPSPSAPFVEHVDAVDPQSPVGRQGLRVNDLIDLRAMSPADRVDAFTYLKDGRHYRLPIVRHGTHRVLDVTIDRNIAESPVWQALRTQFYVGFAGILVMLLLAGFLLVKRPERTDVAMLSGTLILLALGQNFSHYSGWDTMDDALTMAGFIASPFLWNAGLAMLAAYALRFAAPPSRVRQALTYGTYAVALVAAALSAWDQIGWWTGTIDDSFGFFSTIPYGILTSVLPSACPIVCASLALVVARGAERSRLAWATGALAMIYAAPPAAFAVGAAGLDSSFVFAARNAAFPIAAIGLTYALLGARLLDVGFALNRAAVFAAVSIFVVGIFSLGEWALGGWLASASRSTNVAVSALLALALGLAIHPIHALADRVIDRLFFRKRHEAEEALRTFAKEAAFVTDPDLVIARTIGVLLAETDCAFAEVLLHDGGPLYGSIDENDPVLVTLRASHGAVHLRDVATAIRGEYCFPMSAGGGLIGALVVGPKRFGESFAPDERDAIAQLAHGVGVALALLGVSSVTAGAASAVSLATLVAAIEALPEELAARLRPAVANADASG